MPRYSDEDKVEMVRMFLSGKRQEDVAEAFGCSMPTVQAALRASGVPARRGPGSVRKSQRQDHVKVCKVCAGVKPLGDFYEHHRTCKRCELDAEKQRRAENHPRAQVKRVAVQRALAKSKYGITDAEYEDLRSVGMCQICGQRSDRALNIDHDHVTGKVRGVLCNACNRGIGFFDDDPARLLTAADYLQRAAESTPEPVSG